MTMDQNDDSRNQADEDPEARVDRELRASLLWEDAEADYQPTVGQAADSLEFALQGAEIALAKRYLDECQVIGDSAISAHVDGAIVLIRDALRLLDAVKR